MPPDEKDKLGEQLSAYLDGELTAAETAEVEGRIARDPQARELLDELRRTVEAVQALPRRLAPSDLGDGVSGCIEHARLVDRREPPAHALRRARRSVWGMLASAAVVIFAVGGGYWAFQRMGNAPSRNEPRLALKQREAAPAPPDVVLRTAPMSLKEEAGVTTPSVSDQAPAEPKGAKSAVPREAGHGATEVGETPLTDDQREYASGAPTKGLPLGEPDASLAADEVRRQIGVSEERAGPSPAQAAPAYRPEDSLETKLRLGATRVEALRHPFHNEAVKLSVACSSEADRAAVQEKLSAFLASRGIRPLEQAVADDADVVPPSLAFLVAGQPHRNFGEGPEEHQLLVRLPAADLAAVVQEVGASSARRVQLELDRFVVATDAEGVRKVLQSVSTGRAEEHLTAASDNADSTKKSRGRAIEGTAPLHALKERRASTTSQGEPSERDRRDQRSAGPPPVTPAPNTGAAEAPGLRGAEKEGAAETEPAKLETSAELITVVVNLRVSRVDVPAAP